MSAKRQHIQPNVTKRSHSQPEKSSNSGAARGGRHMWVNCGRHRGCGVWWASPWVGGGRHGGCMAGVQAPSQASRIYASRSSPSQFGPNLNPSMTISNMAQ